jgi:NADH-quinone oxidoreductase subunit G
MLANISVHEVPPPDDPDSPFAFSMEGHHGNPPKALPSHYWTPGWNSVQALNQFKRHLSEETPGAQFGVRLFPGTATGRHEYFRSIPEPSTESRGQLLTVAIYHIFGSEPLSSRASAVSERIPDPYVGLNATTAERYGISDGDNIRLSGPGDELALPVRTIASLPDDVVALPAGLVGIAPAQIGGFHRLKKGGG